MATHVYVMSLGFDNLYKIGVATNTNKRLEALRAGNPRMKLIFSVSVKAPKATETHLYKYFAEKRLQREIFKLSDSDLRFIRRYLDLVKEMSLKVRKKRGADPAHVAKHWKLHQV